MRQIRLHLPSSFLLPIAIGILCSCGEEPKPAPVVDSTPVIYQQINGKVKAEELDTFYSHRMKDGVFSGCVLVAQRGVVLYEKAYGWRDHEKRDSLTLDCSFQLASVSKQFTAAAIMLLKQEGKLDYDDTLGKYFPGFPWHGVTVKHLLTHRGGLDKYTNICDNYYREHNIDPPSIFNNDSAIGIMERLGVHAFRSPGEKFDYSNTGYVILAKLVEKISGQPFCDFMQTNFFIPLKMTHTWINTDKQDHPGKAKGYFSKWVYWQENFLDGVSGDKGVFSSVGDMFLWDRSLKNYSILNKEILDEAFVGENPDLKKRKNQDYGYGWRILTFDDGKKAVFHNGWWHGYTSAFYRGISDDVTIIVLCNKFNKGIYYPRPVLEILGAHVMPVPDDDSDSLPKSD
ncbi:MAG TPA: serine hydrolase domain-containing protein [Bacteroidia bacterium]|nr:serine hydrolase domain-containing protein [Bacteroidia bacterium]